jgi:GTP1/Obg family GTP-binding protein
MTINGKQYCNTDEKSVDSSKRAAERRLQEHMEFYEERGIDAVLPATTRSARKSLAKTKKVKSSHFRLRKGHARKLRMHSKKNKRKLMRAARR